MTVQPVSSCCSSGSLSSMLSSPGKRKRDSSEALGPQTGALPPAPRGPAPSEGADGSGGTTRAPPSAALRAEGLPAEGLPLQGCLSQFIQTFGWEPLPSGTEQLLRDIFQTLHGLGFEYSLHEQQCEAGLPPIAGNAGSAPGADRSSDRVLLLKIDFGGAEHQRTPVGEQSGDSSPHSGERAVGGTTRV